MWLEQHALEAAPGNDDTSWMYRSTHMMLIAHVDRIMHIAPHILDGERRRVLLPLYARQLLV